LPEARLDGPCGGPADWEASGYSLLGLMLVAVMPDVLLS